MPHVPGHEGMMSNPMGQEAPMGQPMQQPNTMGNREDAVLDRLYNQKVLILGL